MKLGLREQAGMAALWGTMFLFLLPITAGMLAFQQNLDGMMVMIALIMGCLMSAAVGVLYFAKAVTLLTQHSKEQVAAGRTKSTPTP